MPTSWLVSSVLTQKDIRRADIYFCCVTLRRVCIRGILTPGPESADISGVDQTADRGLSRHSCLSVLSLPFLQIDS